jgi:hypothetical protein
MKAHVSTRKKLAGAITAAIGCLIVEYLVATVISFSTDSLAAALILSILFLPPIFILVGPPIYRRLTTERPAGRPSAA